MKCGAGGHVASASISCAVTGWISTGEDPELVEGKSSFILAGKIVKQPPNGWCYDYHVSGLHRWDEVSSERYTCLVWEANDIIFRLTKGRLCLLQSIGILTKRLQGSSKVEKRGLTLQFSMKELQKSVGVIPVLRQLQPTFALQKMQVLRGNIQCRYNCN